MKKVFNWLAAISAGMGCLMILLGVISGMFIGKSIIPAVQLFIDYWIMGSSFFLFSIFLFLYINRVELRKE